MSESPFAGIEPPGGVDYGSFQFTTKTFALNSLAAWALTAVPSGSGPAVMSCFRVTVAPGSLTLAATDLERVVTASTAAVDTTDTSHVYIPARKLAAILREAPEGTVAVAVKKNQATITAASGTRWVLALPPGDGYPELASLENAKLEPYARLKLLDGLKAVRHAVCKDASRVQLTQVHIGTPEQGAERAVTASDGTRFARAPLGGFPLDCCIPGGVLDDLLRLLEGCPSTDIGVGEVGDEKNGTLVFQAGPVTLAAGKRPYPYPDMDKLLLKPALDNKDVLKVDRAELLAAIRRIRINADAETSAIALEVSKGSVNVVSRDQGKNSAEEAVGAEWDGPDRLLVVNHQFLAEALAAHDSSSCAFRLGKDLGRRRSMVLLAGDASIQIVTQMSPHLVGY